MDVLVRTVEEVERNVADHNPFYIHHILTQGKVLYERRETTPQPWRNPSGRRKHGLSGLILIWRLLSGD